MHQTQVDTLVNRKAPSSMLLELPAQVLDHILQGLDPCSMACAAVTCSRLSNASLASVRQLTVPYNQPETLSSLDLWHVRYTSKLVNLTALTVLPGAKWASDTVKPSLVWPPCPQLRQRHLQGASSPCLQLQPDVEGIMYL
jgi:hypothetical protein